MTKIKYEGPLKRGVRKAENGDLLVPTHAGYDTRVALTADGSAVRVRLAHPGDWGGQQWGRVLLSDSRGLESYGLQALEGYATA